MSKSILCFALIIGGLTLGCGHNPPPPPARPMAAINPLKQEVMDPKAPVWIRKGCGAFFGEKKKLICGVGAIGGMTNPG